MPLRLKLESCVVKSPISLTMSLQGLGVSLPKFLLGYAENHFHVESAGTPFLQLEFESIGSQTCFSCIRRMTSNRRDPRVYQCPDCKKVFCSDCDLFIHESLHSCPGEKNSQNLMTKLNWRHEKCPNQKIPTLGQSF